MPRAKQPQPTQAPIQSPTVQTERKAKFVTVASKLTHKLEIQLCRPRVLTETGQYGRSEQTIFHKVGEVHILNGTGFPAGTLPKGFPRRPSMIEDVGGGYALTPGIPADFFAEWLVQNAETDMVRNGLILASSNMEDLEAEAAEHAKMDCGLQPMNSDGDRRDPRPISGGVSQVKPEARAATA